MKTRVENPKESLKKTQKKIKQNIAVGKKFERNLSVGRPASRPPTVGFLIIGDSGRLVDHCFQQESKALCRSTGAVDRTQPRAKLLQSVDRPIGRSKCTNALWFMSVDRSVNRQSNFSLLTVDRSADRQRDKGKI